MRTHAETVCTEQLEVIGRALKAYQRDQGELPLHLSDLYPQYVGDVSVFHCPADSSAGGLPGWFRWFPGDPKLRVSYLYEFSAHPAPPGPAVPFSPEQPGEGAALREFKQRACRYFGDRVPIVTCLHHPEGRLSLPVAGPVYRGKGNWEDEPASLAAPLARMEEGLAADPLAFVQHWSLAAIAEFYARRLDASLPPALRYRLVVVADRLSAAAEELPAGSHADALYVTALFYRGSGQEANALAAAERGLCLAPGHEGLAFLASDLRYRAKGKRGAPPVDAFLKAELVRQRIPGMAVAVVRNGKTVLADGYGLANVARSVPVTRDTVIQIGSITKSFTASGIMVLVQQGKLAVDDPISRYLPETAPGWKGITIRHLLTHTSGISQDWSQVPEEQRRQADSPEAVVRCLSQVPLDFPPGERHSYCNAGYAALGRTIEVVSGKPLELFLDEEIFRPLQMHGTAKTFTDVGILSTGYYQEGAVLKEAVSRRAWGNGFFVSTVMDLAKWDAALYTDQPLKQSTLAQMWTPAKLNDGSTIDYGFGWVVEGDRGHRVIWHNGGGGGCSTVIKRLPENRLTVIVLTNRDGVNEQAISDPIIRYYLQPSKPIVDGDPQTTRRLKKVLLRLASGEADPNHFTPEAHSSLQPELAWAGAFYQSLGPLKSFRLIEQTREEKSQTCRYRVALGDTRWIQAFGLTAEGRIAEVGIEPE